MRAPAGGRAGSARFSCQFSWKKIDGRLAVVKGCRATILRPPAAPSGAPQGSRELCTTSGACRPGSVWCTKLPVRPPHGGMEYRMRGRRRTKTVHRTAPGWAPWGPRPGPNRAPCGAPVHRTEPGSVPHGTRPAPLRCVRFVDGRLAITLHQFLPDTARVPYNMWPHTP